MEEYHYNEKTKKKIISMLKENTGSHMLDSGGAYGRHWERNQKKKFMKEPRFDVKFEKADAGHLRCDIKKSLFHHLCDTLEYNEEMDKKWIEFYNLPENEEKGWLTLMEEFMKGHTYNSYNGESMLTQVIQYCSDNGGYQILLQIHNGCDVRGGYTAPVFFNVIEAGESDFYRYNFFSIICPEHGMLWESDNGGYDYEENRDKGIKKITDYEVVELKRKPNAACVVKDCVNLWGEKQDLFLSRYKYNGKLVVYNNDLFCPICGEKIIVV